MNVSVDTNEAGIFVLAPSVEISRSFRAIFAALDWLPILLGKGRSDAAVLCDKSGCIGNLRKRLSLSRFLVTAQDQKAQNGNEKDPGDDTYQ